MRPLPRQTSLPCQNRGRHVTFAANRPPPSARPNTSRRPRTQQAQRLSGQNPRRVAIEQLLRIEEEGAFAGLVNGPAPVVLEADDEDAAPMVLASLASTNGRDVAAGLTPQQQRTLRSLVSGVTRWKRKLDYLLSSLSGRSPNDLDPQIRQVLRLALHELLHQSLAPHALSEYVDLARAATGNEGAVRLVNAVLRQAARQLESGAGLPDPTAELTATSSGRDLVRCLAIGQSHPNWMVKGWLQRWGRQSTERLLRHNNTPPTYTVRVNSARVPDVAAFVQQLQQQEVDVERHPLSPTAFLSVHSGLQVLLTAGHVAEGRCVVQDVSAGLVVPLALSPEPGDTLLDCCAAPGGKTLYAASCMQLKGRVTAVDVSTRRLQAVMNMAKTLGVSSEFLELQAADLLDWAPKQASKGTRWDKVLLDAPCSGTGVLAKRADLRWRRSPEDLKQLTDLQAQLLDVAAGLVKPGGVLVYSTCSIEQEENEDQIRTFLTRHPEFELRALSPEEARGKGVDGSVVTEEGYLQTLPHVHGVDGAFAARLVRKA